jgi:hypothetical protein
MPSVIMRQCSKRGRAHSEYTPYLSSSRQASASFQFQGKPGSQYRRTALRKW